MVDHDYKHNGFKLDHMITIINPMDNIILQEYERLVNNPKELILNLKINIIKPMSNILYWDNIYENAMLDHG